MTFAMAIGRKPLSVNARGGGSFTSALRSAAIAHGARVQSGPLYVRITWFQWRRSQGDVDNIAKRILDSLKGIVFLDDDQIVRCLTQKTVADAGRSFSFNPLQIASPTILAELQALLSEEDHVLYIEVGPVTDSMITLGPVV
jgi:hypothetical protein